MQHFVLGQESFVDEDGEPYGFFYVGPEDDEYTQWPWLEGVRFETRPPEPLALHIDTGDEDAGAFADYVDGPIPLVSDRFKRALIECGVANVEFFVVVVDGADSFDDCPQYHAVNIVGKVAASDPSKSTGLEALGGMGATLFDKFVPVPQALGKADFVRMAENLAEVLVSERLRKACERQSIDTLTFTPLVEWRRG